MERLTGINMTPTFPSEMILATTLPTTIHALPEELFDQILHFLPQRQSICSLALTSRDLNRIATPHLYTSITLTSSSFRYLRPLTLLLWTSPKHRLLVRSFTVTKAFGQNLVPWPAYPRLNDVIENMVVRYVKEGERASWAEKVRNGTDHLHVASLLLRSLEYVERMGFDGFELVDPGSRGR